MAATLATTHCQPFPGGGCFIAFKVVLSGNYPTGGETINLSVPAVPIGLHGIPVFVSIRGQNGYSYPYQYGTDYSNGKMMVRIEAAVGVNTPLGEHTAAAYAAGVTGDTITGIAFLK